MRSHSLIAHARLAGITLFAALCLTPPSAVAQDNGQDDAIADQDADDGTVNNTDIGDINAISALFGNAFPKDDEPIYPEKLASGEDIALRILPPGSYRRMMGDAYDQLTTPIMETLNTLPIEDIAKIINVPVSDITFAEGATINDVARIVDPAYKERQRIIFETVSELMTDVFDEVEPSLRQGLARAYARRFSIAEMAEMSAFFDTPTGKKFAVENMQIYTSKEVLAASADIAPLMLEKMASLTDIIKEKSAELPPARTLSDLSDEEREKLANLLGLSLNDLNPAI